MTIPPPISTANDNRPLYEIRPLQRGDLTHVAANLRPDDARELTAIYGDYRYEQRLTNSAELSDEVLICAVGGMAVVIFGIVSLAPDIAAIWCLASPDVSHVGRAFVRESRVVLARWFDERPLVQKMINFTHAENRVHRKWLRSVGAEIFPAKPMGAIGAHFHPFVIRRAALCAIQD